jgi:hypothetical protein
MENQKEDSMRKLLAALKTEEWDFSQEAQVIARKWK